MLSRTPLPTGTIRFPTKQRPRQRILDLLRDPTRPALLLLFHAFISLAASAAEADLPVRSTSESREALSASVVWRWETDGLLLAATDGELAGAVLPEDAVPGRLSAEEVSQRQHRRTRRSGRVVVSGTEPETALRAVSWARRTEAALFFDEIEADVADRAREVAVLGTAEEPPGLPAGTRVERFAGDAQVRDAYRRLWGALDTALWTDPADPYAPACALIAQRFDAALLLSLEEVLAAAPRSLVLCASPRRFEDSWLLQVSRSLSPPDGIGVLTGLDAVTPQLLAHRATAGGRRGATGPVAVAHAANPTAHRQAEVRIRRPGEPDRLSPLSASAFVHALRGSSYLGFSGHGSPSYLRLSRRPDLRIEPEDLPRRLPPLILSAGSCRIFRFWEAPQRSLALTLAGSGAAAVIGFAYSPMEGFLPGQYDGAPAMASHPGFPLGRVVRLLNHAAGAGFAKTPFLFLLGEPHLAAAPEGPTLVGVPAAPGELRFQLRRRDGQEGWAAVSLPAPGTFGTLTLERDDRVLARTSLTQNGFHRDLIAVPRQGFVDVLARVPAAGAVLRLAPAESLAARWARTLLHHLDYALPFMTASHGYGGYLLLIGLWLAGLGAVCRGRLLATCRRRWALLSGYALAAGALFLAYCLLRWPHVDVTTKPLELEPLSALVPMGAALASLATRLSILRRGRAATLAAVAAGLPWLAAGCAIAAAVTGGNVLVARHLGRGLWSLAPAVPLLVTGAMAAAAAALSQPLILLRERRCLGSDPRSRIRPIHPTSGNERKPSHEQHAHHWSDHREEAFQPRGALRLQGADRMSLGL